MQAIPANFSLTFESGKIIVQVIAVFFITSFYDDAFDELGKQELMVKGNKGPFVFQNKYDSNSQWFS